MSKSIITKSNKPITVDLVLQGGAVLGAEQAGKMAALLRNPDIKIRKITGVSAGLLNGAPVAQIFNRHGQTPESSKAVIAFQKDMWLNHLSIHDSYSQFNQAVAAWSGAMDQAVQTVNSMTRLNPLIGMMTRMTPAVMAHEMAKQQGRFQYSQAISQKVSEFVCDIEALNMTHEIALYGEMVNANTNEGVLLKPGDHTAQTTLASMSLEGIFDPQIINGIPFIDGAYAGGSNAPYDPILNSDDEPADAIFVLAANEPIIPYRDVDIKTLTREDLKDSNDLLLSEGLWPFVKAIRDRENGAKNIPPIHLHFRQSGVIYSGKDKVDNGQSHMESLYHGGEPDMARTLKTHGSKLTTTPLVSFDDYVRMAKRNSRRLQNQRRLVAAA